MDYKWEICSFEQGKELKELGITGVPMCIWHDYSSHSDTALGNEMIFPNNPGDYMSMENYYPGYSLAEIASMLGYTFVSSKVKVAAERLIDEIKNGTTKISDANSRLKEAQNAI